jgi:tRNA 2-thiocytidine biosynthesis protein TtcA
MNRVKREKLHGSDKSWKVHRRVGKAFGEFDMLAEDDHVLIGLSGGKDSLCCLDQLAKWQRKLPFPIRLSAVHVQTDIPCTRDDTESMLHAFAAARGVPLHVRRTEVLATLDGEPLNCFHCARRRRIVFFNLAKEIEANKIALGHHLDDIVETTLMNLFFNGSFSTMMPRQELFEGRTHIIRPLALVTERQVIDYATEHDYVRLTCSCEYADDSMRARMKRLIGDLEELYPDVRHNIFGAMRNIDTDYLL